MFLEQIERKQKLQQEKMMREIPSVPGPIVKEARPVKIKGAANALQTQTLGIHNCPTELVEKLTALAKRTSAAQGKRVSVREVVISLLTAAVQSEEV